ncbi:Protein of unknown function [Gryllus bimaculatus]|nr:Protein of unknown function [Gryllus bimaculatus]
MNDVQTQEREALEHKAETLPWFECWERMSSKRSSCCSNCILRPACSTLSEITCKRAMAAYDVVPLSAMKIGGETS